MGGSSARLADFPVRFGTSGARGLVTDLTDAYCWTFTVAFLKILDAKPQGLLIGHDLRPSSPHLAAVCIAAARASGVECHFAGPVPTPALALAGQRRGLPAIMVTGSHIPADRNGLKAYRAEGEISKADERAMLEAAIELPAAMHVPSLPDADAGVLDDYAARYVSAFAPDALLDMRIGVYEQSTVARDLLHRVLSSLGAATVSLARSEVFLPVDTEAIRPEDRDLAQGWGASGAFDAIVSADGDGDRPLLADETGEWLRGDVLGLLTARELGIATVVTPVSSTTAIEKSGAFAQVVRTRIGSPYVIAGMTEGGRTAPVAGFEANGGFLLGSKLRIGNRGLDALRTRDAVLPLVVTLAAARKRRVRISELVRQLPARYTHSDRLKDFPPEQGRALLARLDADTEFARRMLAPEVGKISHIDRTDGFRATFADGSIVHLRPSGNAPELRCYAEAGTAEKSIGLCNACLDRLPRIVLSA